MNIREINIKDLINYLFRRAWIIVLSMLFCSICTILVCKYIIVPQYTASARVYILSHSEEKSLDYTDLQSAEKLTSDFEVLITGRNITDAVIEELKLKYSNTQLVEKIHISSPNNTRILQISVTDSNAVRAARIANCIVEKAVDQIAPIMGIDALNVVYEANRPTYPSSPNIIQDVVRAMILSGFITIMIILMLFALDDTIKTEEDVEKYLGIPTMGVIPKDHNISSNVAGRHENKFRSFLRR